MSTPAEKTESAETARVPIDLGARSYDVVIGQGLLDGAGDLMASVLAKPRAVIITDENVAGLHLGTLEAALKGAGIAHASIVLPPGEATKCFDQLESLVARLLEMKAERSTTLIAFGGGVIGDLAGFAAAVTLRGIDFVQIPTTLLAQVDSSVGGKTGINTSTGKNLVGAFHQPRLVLADTGVLDTLPPRELRAGYAEVVKYGLIGDADFFAWLETNGAAVLSGDPAARRHAIETSCRMKADIVARDEREGGVRALLNLGHTFGHAIEAEAGYGGAVLHGEGVALGMVLAFGLSGKLGLCTPDDTTRVRAHIDAAGLPSSLAALDQALEGKRMETGRLIAHMRQDKKVVDGRMTFVLARGIGEAFLTTDVSEDDLAAFLNDAGAA